MPNTHKIKRGSKSYSAEMIQKPTLQSYSSFVLKKFKRLIRVRIFFGIFWLEIGQDGRIRLDDGLTNSY